LLRVFIVVMLIPDRPSRRQRRRSVAVSARPIGLLCCLPLLSCSTTSIPAAPPVVRPADVIHASVADLFAGAGAPEALPGQIPFLSLEGPLWIAGGGYLLFSDVVESNGPAARIYRLDPGSGRFSPFPYPSAGPTSTNGLAVDTQGRLIACERYNGRLVRVEADGATTVLAERWPIGSAGAPLSAPNDLVVRQDGNIYFTDSDWGARPAIGHARMGVYRVSPAGELSRVLDVEKPNGIVLSPDGSTLYVGSDVQSKVWRLPVDATGGVGAPSLFIDGASSGRLTVPDGMCVDDVGNLYIANNDDKLKAIQVFDSLGHPLGAIPMPRRPSNCSFGGADRRTLYVTTLNALYQIRMPLPGLP
jgi:gluconolactonase